MKAQKCTIVGLLLYTYFERATGIRSTDPDIPFSLPDGTQARTVEDVENWIIEIANKIKKIRS